MPMNDDLVNDVFKQFPGFKNSPTYANGLQVIDSTPERQNTQYGQERVSEFYAPGEEGGGEGQNGMLINPGDKNKAVLEIYRKDELKDPAKKKSLIIGEMLHGMHDDPNWQQMRQEFAQNFTPDAQRKNMHIHKQWGSEGETPEQTMDRTTLDAYIRAGFMPKDKDSPEWTSMYSKQQSATLSKMMDYLRGRNNAKK